MPKAQLIIHNSEDQNGAFDIGSRTTIGRTSDNSICLRDTFLSRQHAVIERCGKFFQIRDLESSNGTFVNGHPVDSTCELRNGDEINFGGSIRASFAELHEDHSSNHHYEKKEDSYTDNFDRSPSSLPKYHPESAPPSSWLMNLGAVVLGLSLTGGSFFLAKPLGGYLSPVEPSVKIISPISGSILSRETRLQIEIPGNTRIRRVVYELDGEEITSSSMFPFSAVLNPNQIKKETLKDGMVLLSARVEYQDRPQMSRTPGVLVRLALAPPPNPNSSKVASTNSSSLAVGGRVQTFSAQLSGKSGYRFSPEFLAMVESQVPVYQKTSGLIPQLRQREFVKAFRDRGVSPLLGLVLVLSRNSMDKNNPLLSGNELGPWKLPPQIARQYLTLNENESALLDPKRSAEIAAEYTRDLLVLFDPEDFPYALACFGKSLQEAAQLRMKLDALDPDRRIRTDFWSFAKNGNLSQNQALAVSRFFAAGLVAEFPQEFGVPGVPLSTSL